LLKNNINMEKKDLLWCTRIQGKNLTP